MNKKYIIHISAVVLFAFVMGTAVTACSDDDTVVVPENWVTVSTEPLIVGYQGTGETDLEVNYTLASGLDAGVPYVVNHDTWCLGYISNGKLCVKVEESEDVHGRTSTFDLLYDASHKVTFTLTQGKAPVVSVTGFDVSGIPATINMGEALDLSEAVTVLPENASFKALTFELLDGGNVVTLSGSTVIGKNPGIARIKVTATSDAEVVGAGISSEVTVKVKGDLKLDRSTWELTSLAGYYLPDGSTGLLIDLIDGKTNTYFSVCKPGKSYNGYSTPAGTKIGFSVDMKTPQTFNYFYWHHRDTSRTMLQVWSIAMYGSNDGTTWEHFKDVTITQNVNQTYSLEADYTYRYLKVEYTSFNTSSGSSAQVAEFYLGRLME